MEESRTTPKGAAALSRPKSPGGNTNGLSLGQTRYRNSGKETVTDKVSH
jgi:hypothetical protein